MHRMCSFALAALLACTSAAPVPTDSKRAELEKATRTPSPSLPPHEPRKEPQYIKQTIVDASINDSDQRSLSTIVETPDGPDVATPDIVSPSAFKVAAKAASPPFPAFPAERSFTERTSDIKTVAFSFAIAASPTAHDAVHDALMQSLTDLLGTHIDSQHVGLTATSMDDQVDSEGNGMYEYSIIVTVDADSLNLRKVKFPANMIASSFNWGFLLADVYKRINNAGDQRSIISAIVQTPHYGNAVIADSGAQTR